MCILFGLHSLVRRATGHSASTWRFLSGIYNRCSFIVPLCIGRPFIIVRPRAGRSHWTGHHMRITKIFAIPRICGYGSSDRLGIFKLRHRDNAIGYKHRFQPYLLVSLMYSWNHHGGGGDSSTLGEVPGRCRTCEVSHLLVANW